MAATRTKETQFAIDGLTTELPVRLIWRKRQKRIRLRLDTDAGILKVSAPRNVSEKRIMNFLEQEEAWIRKQWQKFETAVADVSREKHAGDNHIFIWGSWWPVITKQITNRGKTDVMVLRLKQAHIECAVGGKPTELQVPAELKQKFLERLARRFIPARVRKRGEEMGLEPDKVYIRSQKTKWGSCSSRKNVSFNWRLIMCPIRIIDYLIVHELSHLQHMNHGEQFWKLVEAHYPDRKEAQRWLKENEFFLFNYP